MACTQESETNVQASTSRGKRKRPTVSIDELLLGRVNHEHLQWRGCNQDNRKKYNQVLARLVTKDIYSPCIVDWELLNNMGCGETVEEMIEIKLIEAGGDEELFVYEACKRAFNCQEVIYKELCQEFFSTYQMDENFSQEEICAKKIIKYRLGGRAHSVSLVEFARYLGLYRFEVLNEEGFEIYFQSGLRDEGDFKAEEYWSRISTEDELRLSRSACNSIRSPILRLLQKMIAYSVCQRTTGYDKIQKHELWLMSMFEDRNNERYANVAWVIARWMKRKGKCTQDGSKIIMGSL